MRSSRLRALVALEDGEARFYRSPSSLIWVSPTTAQAEAHLVMCSESIPREVQERRSESMPVMQGRDRYSREGAHVLPPRSCPMVPVIFANPRTSWSAIVAGVAFGPTPRSRE